MKETLSMRVNDAQKDVLAKLGGPEGLRKLLDGLVPTMADMPVPEASARGRKARYPGEDMVMLSLRIPLSAKRKLYEASNGEVVPYLVDMINGGAKPAGDDWYRLGKQEGDKYVMLLDEKSTDYAVTLVQMVDAEVRGVKNPMEAAVRTALEWFHKMYLEKPELFE